VGGAEGQMGGLPAKLGRVFAGSMGYSKGAVVPSMAEGESTLNDSIPSR
jgi:hypothetical protein